MMIEATIQPDGYRFPCRFAYRSDLWFVFVADLTDAESVSVTNGAGSVIEFLSDQGLVPGRVVLYRDSTGRWDQLVVNEKGRFSGFAAVGYEGDDFAGACDTFIDRYGSAKEFVRKAIHHAKN